ncbi:MAG: hypothetical protein ACLFUJ_12055 [Phycisphaerae bacterium]
MSLDNAFFLLLLVPVAIVAAVALARPARLPLRVGSLRLWQEAARRVGSRGRKSERRISASWVLLLLGSVLAVLSLAGANWQRPGTVRRIVLEIGLSAELGPDPESLRRATGLLLSRLQPQDLVRIGLPLQAAGKGPDEWLSPDQARQFIDDLGGIPVPARAIRFRRDRIDGPQTVRFIPAGAEMDSSINAAETVWLPGQAGAVRIEQFAAESVGEDQLAVFVGLVNSSDRQVGVSLRLSDATGAVLADSPQIPLEPQSSGHWIARVSSSEALVAQVLGSEGLGTWSYLVRRRIRPRKVALSGRFDQGIRRFVRSHPGLELVEQSEQADLEISIGRGPVAGIPQLIFDPPGEANPRLWRRRQGLLGPLQSGSLSMPADHPVTQGVWLEGTAIRSTFVWEPMAGAGGSALFSLPEGAAAVLDSRQGQRRIWFGFDPSWANATLSSSPGWIALLTNAVDWLAPGPQQKVVYTATASRAALPGDDWQAVGGRGLNQGGWAWPGLYRDGQGQLHAVNVSELSWTGQTEALEQQVGRVRLQPASAKGGEESLWPAFLIGAVLFWFVGWWLRGR